MSRCGYKGGENEVDTWCPSVDEHGMQGKLLVSLCRLLMIDGVLCLGVDKMESSG